MTTNIDSCGLCITENLMQNILDGERLKLEKNESISKKTTENLQRPETDVNNDNLSDISTDTDDDIEDEYQLLQYKGTDYLINQGHVYPVEVDEDGHLSHIITGDILGKVLNGQIILDSLDDTDKVDDDIEGEYQLVEYKGYQYFINTLTNRVYGIGEDEYTLGEVVGNLVNNKIIFNKKEETDVYDTLENVTEKTEEPIYDTLENVTEKTEEPIYDTLETIEEEPLYDNVFVSHLPQYPIYDNNDYSKPIYQTPEPIDSSDDESVYGFIETDKDVIENLEKKKLDLRSKLDNSIRYIVELEDEINDEINLSDKLFVENNKLKETKLDLCDLVNKLDLDIMKTEYELFKELCFGDELLRELKYADDVNKKITNYFLDSIDFNYRLTSKVVNYKNKLSTERDAYVQLYKQFIAREDELMKENARLKRSNELLKQTELKKTIRKGRKENKITNEYEQV